MKPHQLPKSKTFHLYAPIHSSTQTHTYTTLIIIINKKQQRKLLKIIIKEKKTTYFLLEEYYRVWSPKVIADSSFYHSPATPNQ